MNDKMPAMSVMPGWPRGPWAPSFILTGLAMSLSACGGATSSTQPSPKATAATLTATQIVNGLVNDHLPAHLSVSYTKSTDPNHLMGKAGGYTSKAAFVDTRASSQNVEDNSMGSVDLGGSVEVFPTTGAAIARENYLKSVETSPLLGEGEGDKVIRGALLRLSSNLTASQRTAYENSFTRVMEGYVSTAKPTGSAAAGGKAVILKSGFGQQGQYVWYAALVKNNTGSRGQSVSVTANLFSGHRLVKSDTQVESFARVGDEVVIGNQAPVGHHRITHATFRVTTSPGVFTDQPQTIIPVSHVAIGRDEFGGYEVKATLKNTTGRSLSSPRIGVLCMNARGHVNGGSADFPDTIPARSSYRDVIEGVIVTGTPTHCTVTAQPDFS